MVVDPMTRRAEGVSPLTPADLAGSVGKDGYGVNLPTATAGNPGPTFGLRGIEPNTNLRGSDSEPMLQTNTADGPPPSDPVFISPDTSGYATILNVDKDWGGDDCAYKNSKPMPVPISAFNALGEQYPGSEGGF